MFLRKIAVAVFVSAFLGFGQGALAVETIQLDPNAKPTPPPVVIKAWVREEGTGHACFLRLMPNGVLELQRPCALERRLGDALAWTRDAETLALRTANGTVLAMFHKSRYGTFRTKNAQPPQLVLSLLPQDSMPMSQ